MLSDWFSIPVIVIDLARIIDHKVCDLSEVCVFVQRMQRRFLLSD